MLNVQKLYEAIDACDVEAFSRFLTDDVIFRYANAPPVHGAKAAKETLAAFFTNIKGIAHDVEQVWNVDNDTFLICTVEYVRLDGSSLTVPASVLLRHKNGLIAEYLIFVDVSEL